MNFPADIMLSSQNQRHLLTLCPMTQCSGYVISCSGTTGLNSLQATKNLHIKELVKNTNYLVFWFKFWPFLFTTRWPSVTPQGHTSIPQCTVYRLVMSTFAFCTSLFRISNNVSRQQTSSQRSQSAFQTTFFRLHQKKKSFPQSS